MTRPVISEILKIWAKAAMNRMNIRLITRIKTRFPPTPLNPKRLIVIRLTHSRKNPRGMLSPAIFKKNCQTSFIPRFPLLLLHMTYRMPT